jgi:polysaccharide pyruvyl transferase WcaK-like protein
MFDCPHVVLLHAYSSKNSGDGLLVDLSTQLIRQAVGEAARISIVAADPASFPEYSNMHPAPVLAEKRIGRIAGAAGLLLPVDVNRRMRPLLELLRTADLVVGVGGGYLRARNCIEALKLEAGHLLQMRAACATGKPTVYLPQSIGPLMPEEPLRSHLSSMLAKCSSVFVRDERSAQFLVHNRNTQRAPDLAVMDFERRGTEILARAEKAGMRVSHVAFVLRRAPSWTAEQRERYETSTRRLIDLLRAHCRLSFAVQSTGRGNDDLAYYRSINIDGELKSLKSMLATDRPDAVVSVRLHGALESLLNGVPSYHLSYERKGFGAYADLGLDDWVSNAADFDPEQVAAKLLKPDAIRDFWQRASSGFAHIREGSHNVRTALLSALGA